MGFKDKLNSFANKTKDAIVNAKVTYEKGCVEFTCFSLKDVRKSEDVLGIANYEKKQIEFSGSLDLICKDIEKPWFFVSPEGKVIELDEATVKQDNIEIQLNTKKENYLITKAKFKEKTLILK